MKRFLILILAAFLPFLALAQEKVVKGLELKNGDVLNGSVEIQGDGSYLIKLASGDVIIFSSSEVSKIVEEEIPVILVVASGSGGGHDFVDLGLTVKWATSNVGAPFLSNYGSYYAWGETASKYIISERFGAVDYKTQLDDEDDAASVNWSGKWRIPTWSEWEELMVNCQWEWTKVDDVRGYMVTSNINGNKIFLPAAGNHNGSSVGRDGKSGYYWSASLSRTSDKACYLLFGSKDIVYGEADRCDAFSVRPVME